MDISKFIKDNDNPYTDNFQEQFNKVVALVDQKVISPRFAKFLLGYLLRKEISGLIKSNLENIFQKKNKEKWLMINYSKRLTRYL